MPLLLDCGRGFAFFAVSRNARRVLQHSKAVRALSTLWHTLGHRARSASATRGPVQQGRWRQQLQNDFNKKPLATRAITHHRQQKLLMFANKERYY